MIEVACGFTGSDEDLNRERLIQSGPSLRVSIGFDKAYDDTNPRRLPNLPFKDVPALIDTGAGSSCIDAALAAQLGLPVVDRRLMAGVGGAGVFEIHMAQMHAPALKFTFWGSFAGVHLSAGGQHYAVLIGRDFLSHFRMAYEGPSGAVTLIDPNAPLPTPPPWEG